MISRTNFIGEYIEDITKKYNFIKCLGEGFLCKKYRCQNLATGHICACKKIVKHQIKNFKLFKSEIDLLRAADHPNIIKLFAVFEDKVYLYLLMEECCGGSLFERLEKKNMKKNTFSEAKAAKIFKQILEALNYLHSHGVCHRDLKPENIMFSTMEENSHIKLIGFLLCKIFKGEDNIMKNTVGTLFYMAPEVIKGEYNEKCDIWALGVILYIILCGKPPFYSKNEDELKEKIINIEYSFNHEEFKNVSKEAMNVISKIFVTEDKRPTASELLQCEWLKSKASNSKKILDVDWSHIKEYSELNLMQKSVVYLTAFHLLSSKTKQFVDIFKYLDKNSDGVLNYEEIKNAIHNSEFRNEIKDDDIKKLFEKINISKDGIVTFTEFLSALIDYKKIIKKEDILDCFRTYDTNEDGKISKEEFCNVIKPQNDQEKEEILKLFKEFDLDGDGQIDFEEFMKGFIEN